MTLPRARLSKNDDIPPELFTRQEILANGAACGHRLRTISTVYGMNPVKYASEYFDPDDEQPKAPITEATMFYGVDDLPILAWVVNDTGGLAAIVVDLVERIKEGESPYTNCRVVQGTAGEVLPREILEKMGLS